MLLVGGVNKTPVDTRNLFNLRAQNTQQFGARELQIKRVNEIGSNSSIESQLSHITVILNKIITGGSSKSSHIWHFLSRGVSY